MMMMSFMSILMMVLSGSLGRGGGNELIQYIPTADYWQARNVEISVETMQAQLAIEIEAQPVLDADALKALEEAGRSQDPAIARAAHALLSKHHVGDKPGQVRRLMAIRALADLGDKRAIPILQPLLQSTEPFIADHAGRALARLEGRAPVLPTADRASREQDLWLLPRDLGAVGQIALGGGEELVLAKLLAELPPDLAREAQDFPRMLLDRMLPLIEQTGNVRIDSVTFGLSERIGPRDGYCIIIGHGQYDPGAMAYVVGRSGKSEVVDGMTVYRPDREAALIFPDGNRAVLLIAANSENLPLGQVIAALHNGAGELRGNAAVTALVETIDRDQPMWLAVQMSAAYRQAPVLRAFDTLTLIGRQDQGTTRLEVNAAGSDAGQVKQAVDELNGYIGQGLAEMEPMAAQVPMIQPYIDFLKSINLVADGTGARLTADMKAASPAALLMPFVGFQSRHVVEGEIGD